MIAFLIALLLTFTQVTESPECAKWDAFASYAGMEKMEWLGYPDGWAIPFDTEFLPDGRTEFDDNTGVWGYVSPSTGERFVFYFWDMTVDGDPPGLHHLCGPFKAKP